MQYLFNSNGEHIANFVNGHFHHPRGKNIGHYLPEYKIFIDMDGRYLGEFYERDRLMFQKRSPYLRTRFGRYGNYGNVRNYGNPGRYSRLRLPYGVEDIDSSKIQV